MERRASDLPLKSVIFEGASPCNKVLIFLSIFTSSVTKSVRNVARRN